MREVLSRAGRFRQIAPKLKGKDITHKCNGYLITFSFRFLNFYITHKRRGYPVCFNPGEARQDKLTLEDIASKLIDGPGRARGNTVYLGYLKVTRESVVLDEKNIKHDERGLTESGCSQ